MTRERVEEGLIVLGIGLSSFDKNPSHVIMTREGVGEGYDDQGGCGR